MKKLFSLIPLYVVLSWLYLIILSTDMITLPPNTTGFTAVLVFVIGLFTTIATLVSVFTHLDNLATLRPRKVCITNSE